MLDKLKGIKPTHLWHVTSQKLLKDHLKGQLEARKGLLVRFSKPKHVLTITAIVWPTLLALFYSMGMFTPEKTLQQLLPFSCKPMASSTENKDVCKKQEPAVPKKLPVCPPEPKPKSKPC